MTEIVNVITSVGFPIFCCLAMGYYVKYMTDQNRQDVKDMNEKHKEEVDKMTEAINNNTLALQVLCDKIGEEK